MLIDLLSHPDPGFEETHQARRALQQPGCWPRDVAHITVAQRLGASLRAQQVGETLLVAITQDCSRTTLLHLARNPRHTTLFEPQGPDARAALTLAGTLAPMSLTTLTMGTPSRPEGSWEISPVFIEGTGASAHVDGASFGLAMLLAHASEWLDEPVPSDLVALAALCDDGRLARVDGIAHKLAMVRATALSVRRVVVSADQEREALQYAGDALEVIAVDTAREAVARVFTDLDAKRRARWTEPSAIDAELDELFSLVLAPPRDASLHWPAVADLAAALETLVNEGLARDKAAFAQSVAARHAGHTGELAWPSERLLSSLPPSVRWRALAQGVQSLVDSGSADVREKILSVLTRLDGADTTRETLELRGAIGRALAQLREYERARAVLSQAVDGWWEIYESGEASRALCELMRLCGVVGDVEGVRRALTKCRAFERAHSTKRASIAYLRWATGRAFVQTGCAREALEALDAVRLAGLEDHVIAGVLRWRANAHQTLGEVQLASELRARAARTGVRGAAEFVALDAALASPEVSDETLGDILDELEAIGPQGIHGLLELDAVRARAERVAREYPY
jgi:hypothetical protein